MATDDVYKSPYVAMPEASSNEHFDQMRKLLGDWLDTASGAGRLRDRTVALLEAIEFNAKKDSR